MAEEVNQPSPTAKPALLTPAIAGGIGSTLPDPIGGPVRVVVDLTLCQGYAQCAFLAPESFKLSGEEALMYDPGPDDAQRERILRAAAACPVRAIFTEPAPGTKA
jgi:ferredoxin